jgi:hypothetical protein
MELRLTTLASRHAANLQVAALTASTPSLKLHQRRLLDDGLAIGRLQDRPAVQTCLIGSGHGVTAAALHGLKPHQAANASLLLQRWLGLDRHAGNTCLLVTVVQDQPPGSRPSSQAMVQTMQALLRAI